MEEALFYVSPNGLDTNPGTEQEPFGSPGAALARMRASSTGIKRIVLRGGSYYDVSLRLTAADSGLTIEAYPGECPVLYGGLPVTAWEREGEFLTARLDGVQERVRDFRVLAVNGSARKRARLPETGFFRHRNVFDVPWMSTLAGGWKRKPTAAELTELQYEPGDIGPWLDPNNAELTIYHEWDESLVGLRSIDPETGTLTFANEPTHPPGAFADRNTHANEYVVWNVKEGVTAPGQWYLDRTDGKLVYWPLPGESAENLQIVAPSQNRIIQMDEGTERVTFKGLTLACSTAEMTAGNFIAMQVDAAVLGKGVRDIAFEQVTVCHTSGWAIRLQGERLRIVGCHIHHTGAGGIHAEGEEILLANTRLYDIGLAYQSAVAVYFSGKRNAIRHNDIHHTPYSGVVIGHSSDTAIAGNLFANVMTFMKDGAAVYCTSASTVAITGNAVFGEPGSKKRSYAYYLDELCENCTVEGNLAINTGLPVLCHISRDCSLTNNVFLDNGSQVVAVFNSSGLVFERNILAADSIELHGPRGDRNGFAAKMDVTEKLQAFSAADGFISLRNNLFHSKSGQAVFKEVVQYTVVREFALQEAAESSLFAAAGIGVLADGVIAADVSSPAGRLGIRPLSFTGAGCSGDFTARLRQSGFSTYEE